MKSRNCKLCKRPTKAPGKVAVCDRHYYFTPARREALRGGK